MGEPGPTRGDPLALWNLIPRGEDFDLLHTFGVGTAPVSKEGVQRHPASCSFIVTARRNCFDKLEVLLSLYSKYCTQMLLKARKKHFAILPSDHPGRMFWHLSLI